MASPEVVASFARGLSVIRSFGVDARRQTLSDVAERTSLSRAAARRFLLTLVDLGYARSDGRHFELTPAILDLGYAYLSSLDTWDALQPALDAVSRDLDESASAAVLDGTDIVYIARAAARHRILSIGLRVGTRLPAHATSMGQVLLANLEPAALQRYFRRTRLQALTPCTITQRADLEARLAQVREREYALCDGELESGLRSLAVPVYDRRRTVVAAINVSTHGARTGLEAVVSTFLPRLRQASLEVSRSI